jgi:glyoxylase-like metal-dependent hydrolase (beta-lactamase superfamily II)
VRIQQRGAPVAVNRQLPYTDEKLHVDIQSPGKKVFAVEYARSKSIPVAKLVQTDTTDTVDMSWYFYVIVGDGKVILVDSGTDQFIYSMEGTHTARGAKGLGLKNIWQIKRFRSVEETLAVLGLKPKDVTDIILTHHHWDHVDGIKDMLQATVYIHKTELAAIRTGSIVAGGNLVSGATKDTFDVLEYRSLNPNTQQLITFSDATYDKPYQPMTDISVIESGLHTEKHVAVIVNCEEQHTIAISGDSAYLYKNIDEGLPITLLAPNTDPQKNVEDVQRLAKLVGAKERVLPGHDPAVFSRFPSAIDGLAVICK